MMDTKVFLAFLTVISCASTVPFSNRTGVRSNNDPDAYLTTPELIAKNGYPAESHTVTTEDGYILTIHRIPYGKAGPSADRPVVLMQHGLTCSSAGWVITVPEKSLAFILADAGYDVWLGNTRGNNYAREHISLSPSDKQFWQFSWHETGIYDLPAMIDYALQKTGQQQLFYIGHSMGTTEFFVMASSKPDYNSKIRAYFGLAPVAFLSNMKSDLLRFIASFDSSVELLDAMIGTGELKPTNAFLSQVSAIMCDKYSMTEEICSNLLFLLCGYDKDQFNATLLPSITGHFPAGSSTHQVLHYAQGINTDKFRQYNYGWAKNLLTYGSLDPPDYDLSQITAPVFLHWSDNDLLADVEDVKKLEGKLPNVKQSRRVPYEKFNHLDFVFAIDVKSLLYDSIVDVMKDL